MIDAWNVASERQLWTPEEWQPIQFDAWRGNVVNVVNRGILFFDFGAACRGPAEWDYAGLDLTSDLPDHLKEDTFSALHPVRLLTRATLCWAYFDKSLSARCDAIRYVGEISRALELEPAALVI